jgi:hypothetical protein
MIENMNDMLSPEELENVNGGVIASAHRGGTNSQDKSEAYEKHKCKGTCNRITVFKAYSGGRCVCTECGWVLQ